MPVLVSNSFVLFLPCIPLTTMPAVQVRIKLLQHVFLELNSPGQHVERLATNRA